MAQRQRRDLSDAELEALEQRIADAAPAGLTDDEFLRYFEPRMEQAIAELEYTPAPLQGSAGRRGAAGLWETLNPVTIATGLYQTARHPIQTAVGIGRQHAEQFGKGMEAMRQGEYVQGLGHLGASALPVIGPAAAHIGEYGAETGDVAGMLGQAGGLVGPGMIRPTAQAVRAGTARVAPGLTNRVAGALEQGAADRFVKVMRPELGTSKLRFGSMAEKVAPELAKVGELATWTMEGLRLKVGSKLQEFEALLDAAHDARLGALTFKTDDVIAALKKKRAELEMQPLQGTKIGYQPITVKGANQGKPVTTWITNQGPLGEPVVNAPNRMRVSQIDQAIRELEQHGPYTRYDQIRQMRGAWDKPARQQYAPSITQDYLAKVGESAGAADITGVLREYLSKWDPVTAKANQPYSLYKNANDVLQATHEIQRSRPEVMSRILRRVAAMTGGAATGGTTGAGIAYALSPVLDAVSGMGVTTQLKTARLMSQLAHFIRTGDVTGALAKLDQLNRIAPLLGATERYRQRQQQPAEINLSIQSEPIGR